MANIEKIKPGQILHDYHRETGRRARMGYWLVKVIEVDLEKKKSFV